MNEEEFVNGVMEMYKEAGGEGITEEMFEILLGLKRGKIQLVYAPEAPFLSNRRVCCDGDYKFRSTVGRLDELFGVRMRFCPFCGRKYGD